MAQHIALYFRISLDASTTQVGVTRQRKDSRAIAEIRWPGSPVIEYVDNNQSAYQARAKRPARELLMAAIKRGEVLAVVAWNLDRLLRQPRELEQLIDLGVPIVTASGDLDLTTHDGQLHARILSAVAKKSSDDGSRRVKRAHQDRAERGLFHGARHLPYGYVRGAGPGELVVDVVAAETIRVVARAVVEGEGLTAAIRTHSPTTGPTSREAWRLLLSGPIIRGMNTRHQPAAWPAIIDEEMGASLTRALAKNSRTRPNKVWPLSSVATCGKCGGKLWGQVNRGWPNYSCRKPGCHGVSINSVKFEADIRVALDNAAIVVPAAERRPVADQSRLEHLAEEYALGHITRQEWEAARRVSAVLLTEPINAVRQGKLEGVTLPLERCAEIIDKIIVRPIGKGGRYDPDRITIHWRA